MGNVLLLVGILLVALIYINSIFKEKKGNQKNPSKLNILLGILGVGVMILGISLKDYTSKSPVIGPTPMNAKPNYSNNSSSTKEIDYNNLKTQVDLNNYVLERANAWCEVWQRACNYSNETKRWQEQVYTDGMIDNFTMSVLPAVVQNNDLPSSYIEPANELFLNKMKECGWSPNRSDWPGQH